jgi:hypothetical protein
MATVCQSIGFACGYLGVEAPMFVVVLFNDPALGQYASNCQKSDIITAMRETADRLEKGEDVVR